LASVPREKVPAAKAFFAERALANAWTSGRQIDRREPEGCPCGSEHFQVIYTFRGWGGTPIRRRECRHCGKRMTTWEKPIGR
jgi:hypothetical protein